MSNSDLDNYVREMLRQGRSVAEITAALRESGWDEGEVQTAIAGSAVSESSPPSAPPYKQLLTNARFLDWLVGFFGSVLLFVVPPSTFALMGGGTASPIEAAWMSFVLIFSWPLATVNWPFTYLDTSLLIWFARVFGPGAWKVWGIVLSVGFVVALVLTWKRYPYVRRGMIWFAIIALIASAIFLFAITVVSGSRSLS